MSRRHEMDHQFVEVLPTQLDSGVLYISGTHSIVAHLCCCGCGSEVVTPLGPAGWTLRYNGRVSLSPSIGNGAYACRSHYVIQTSHVRWLSSMTPKQHLRDQARDQAAAQQLNLSWLHRAKRMLGDLVRRTPST
jgi:isoaspartyl peptidase/L-asparaginase-like protein (Ntn-hydrolase superfamily)